MDAKAIANVISLLVLLIAISGCSLSGRNENTALNPYEKFYTGKDGVIMSYQSIPTKLYYYGPDDNAANQFVIGVNAENKGASFTRGGIYLSGYNPDMIQIKEVPIKSGQLGACGISIGSIGYGVTGLIGRCDGVSVSSDFSGTTNIKLDNIMGLIQDLTGRHTSAKWLDPEKFQYSLQVNDNDQGTTYMVNMNNMNLMVDYYQHGRLMIAWLSGIDFRRTYGQEILLAGDTYEFPGGETAYLEYNGQITDWPAGLDQTTQHFMLTSCYMYTTFADPIVCIDPDPLSDVRKVCTPRSKTWSSGNGAPVALTSVEQENTPRKIIFRLNIKNIGTGTVYDAGMLEKCSPYYSDRVTPQDLNVIYLGDVRVGNVGLKGRGGTGQITCSPEIIRLDPKTKTGSTTCTYPMEYTQVKSAYEAPLTVELWYGYSEILKRDIQIKRII